MKHIAVIKEKPVLSGKQSIPDGAITGNGDLAVILGNSENGMKIHISKCDLWYAVEKHSVGGLRPMGNIDIDIPAELYDNYHAEQNADDANIKCVFENGGNKLELLITVLKTENAILVEENGNITLPVPQLKACTGKVDGRTGKDSKDGIDYIYRIFDDELCEYVTEAYATEKAIGNGRYLYCVETNHDTENPLDYAIDFLKNSTDESVNNLIDEHKKCWKEFRSKSSVKLSDEKLENLWYQSNYLLAVCCGNREFPPGLFGNFITVEGPAWKSDYHLNYNYQAPFYALCSSNHPELTDCYSAPLEEFIETGKKYASVFGCRGVIYPVGLQPKGHISEYQPNAKNPFMRLFLGQKNNQIHPADIMIIRWKSTRDTDYAREHAYPYLKECLEFFEDLAVKEKGKYNIYKDAAHEVPYYKEDFSEFRYRKVVNTKNNVLTLGLLRMGLDAGIDMAKALGIDEDKQKIWQDMLDNLADFPVFHRKFRKVYRYTEKGQAWHPDNTVGLQHIYPAGCIDLNSDEKTLKIARNTITVTPRWYDDNGTNSLFPAAIRVGLPADFLLGKLRENIDEFLLPNMLFKRYGGCLENCSLVPNVINEMALQSNRDVLRFFPVWDNSLDCEYNNLRADGAFLVSGSIKSGKIGTVTIFSEKGEKLTYINPFTGEKVSRPTVPGEIIEIKE